MICALPGTLVVAAAVAVAVAVFSAGIGEEAYRSWGMTGWADTAFQASRGEGGTTEKGTID